MPRKLPLTSCAERWPRCPMSPDTENVQFSPDCTCCQTLAPSRSAGIRVGDATRGPPIPARSRVPVVQAFDTAH